MPELRRDEEQREIHAQREQRAVRQVDGFHHAHDQHEAQRDQREQQAQRNAVDEVGKETEAASPCRAFSLISS